MLEPDSPPDVDLTRPNAARMWDYLLDGAANFDADRQAIHEIQQIIPDAAYYAQCNRTFLRRAVSFCASRGVDQFLDLGSGIPTVGNVHEVAHQVNPDARIAYVDIEPVAISHAQQMLGGTKLVTTSRADIRDPESVLRAPGVAGLLDLSRPVVVLAVGILPFIPEAKELMSRYRRAVVAGSYLAVSHISRMSWADDQMARLMKIMERTPTPERERSRDEVAELLDGWRLVEPGVVPAPRWHPSDGEPTEEEALRSNCYVGLAHHG